MDNRAEPPSWRSGAAPVAAQGSRVATGAGPSAGDQGEEDSRGQGHAADGEGHAADGPEGYATDFAGGGAPAGNDQVPGFGEAAQGAPPGFTDAPQAGFGSPFGPGYTGFAPSDGPSGMPDTPEVRQGGAPARFGAGAGFGDVPAEYVDAPATPGHDPYYGGPASAGPGFGAYSAGAPDYPGGAQSFDNGQLADPFANGPVYGGEPSPGTATRDPGPAYSPSYSPPPVQSARARVTASLKAAKRVKTPKRSPRPGRQAQLTVARVEPWSVMKFSFVISLVAFIVLFVAVAVLYGVLSGLGVFDALQRTVSSITSSQGSTGFNIQGWLSASRVLGYTGLLGAINVVLITAVCTVGSVLYNITADLAGGVEVTLKETE